VATCLQVVVKSDYIAVSDAVSIKGNRSIAKCNNETQMMA